MWKKFSGWLRANFLATGLEDLQAKSIQKIVTTNALNRRKNTRIRYSHIGAVGDLPRVFLQNDELNVGNISTGGVLVVDDTGRLGNSVGDLLNIELRWPDTTVKVRSRLVGANLHRRHLQFVDFNANIFVRVSQLIKSGFLGSKFHKVDTHNSNVVAEELWIGPTSESLVFHRRAENFPVAELQMNGDVYEFHPGQLPVVKKTGQVTSAKMLSEILVLLANIKDPSHNVRDLIERLQSIYHKPQHMRSGTHG